ncbi:hypothetical protein [Corynebacterium lowii]|uniref:Uncharacterized protein n=1 Tax=Corynebacterium lowii TaxID=1544413 RepID=A0A0N8W0M3_9CORY|nr:hypothetical protein [Corynebacterium lowii]KQB87098.1 hypothetical protein Clow_00146 [Corynebacterium lowii]MDP9852317.1 hypothetical protein [Corynebacterium lowii]
MTSTPDMENNDSLTPHELEELDNLMAMYDELDRQDKPGFLWSDIFGFSLKKKTRPRTS